MVKKIFGALLLSLALLSCGSDHGDKECCKDKKECKDGKDKCCKDKEKCVDGKKCCKKDSVKCEVKSDSLK